MVLGEVVLAVSAGACVIGLLASFVSELFRRIFGCMFSRFSFSKGAIRCMYLVMVALSVGGVELLKCRIMEWKIFGRWHPPLINACQGDRGCVEQQLTFRMAGSLIVLFGVLFWLMLCGRKSAYRAHVTAMPFKAVALPTMFLGSLFIPNSIFYALGTFCLCASLVFLVLQIAALLDFSYSWNESWCANDGGRENSGWLMGILLCGATLTIGSLVTGIMIAVQSPSALCTALVSIVLVFGAFLAGLAMTDYIAHGALLPSAFVMAYSIFQIWAAFQGYAAYEPSAASVSTRKTAMIIMAFLMLGYNSLTIAAQPDVYHVAPPPLSEASVDDLLSSETTRQRPTSSSSVRSVQPVIYDEEDSDTFVDVGQLQWFHLVLLTFAFYYGMVGCNWLRLPDGEVKSSLVLSHPSGSFGVLCASAFCTLFLYGWTLAAPVVFPDRQF